MPAFLTMRRIIRARGYNRVTSSIIRQRCSQLRLRNRRSFAGAYVMARDWSRNESLDQPVLSGGSVTRARYFPTGIRRVSDTFEYINFEGADSFANMQMDLTIKGEICIHTDLYTSLVHPRFSPRCERNPVSCFKRQFTIDRTTAPFLASLIHLFTMRCSSRNARSRWHF